MKFNFKYSAQLRPIFRVLAIVIALPMLGLGCLVVNDILFYNQAEVKDLFQIAIPQVFFGSLLLIAGIKGRLPKWMDNEDNENRIRESSTREKCLKGLIGPLLIVFIFTFLFFVEQFSIAWWGLLIYEVILLYMFYLTSVILLIEKGYNDLLVFTFIFPIALLAIGAISPKVFENLDKKT